jgi:hypothetical protein
MGIAEEHWRLRPKRYFFVLAISLAAIQVIGIFLLYIASYYFAEFAYWLWVSVLILMYTFFVSGVYRALKWALYILKILDILVLLAVLGVLLNPFLWPLYNNTIRVALVLTAALWLGWWLYAFHIAEKIEKS